MSHSLGGFVLNKIPLLRKLKLNEVVSARYLKVHNFEDHIEVGIGIEKLNFFRVDFIASINENGSIKTGVVIGLKGALGAN